MRTIRIDVNLLGRYDIAQGVTSKRLYSKTFDIPTWVRTVTGMSRA
jgi:hypothetical protein